MRSKSKREKKNKPGTQRKSVIQISIDLLIRCSQLRIAIHIYSLSLLSMCDFLKTFFPFDFVCGMFSSDISLFFLLLLSLSLFPLYAERKKERDQKTLLILCLLVVIGKVFAMLSICADSFVMEIWVKIRLVEKKITIKMPAMFIWIPSRYGWNLYICRCCSSCIHTGKFFFVHSKLLNVFNLREKSLPIIIDSKKKSLVICEWKKNLRWNSKVCFGTREENVWRAYNWIFGGSYLKGKYIIKYDFTW